MKRFLTALLILLCAPVLRAANSQYLYKVSLVQAAPGKLLELIESPAQIGPYLRRFISTHHDTLAAALK